MSGKFVALVGALLAFTAFEAVPASAGYPPPMCPGPTIAHLGRAGPMNYTVLSLAYGKGIRFSSGWVEGNAAVANYGLYDASGNSILTGKLFLDSQASVHTSGAAETQGGVVRTSLTGAVNDAYAGAAYFARLHSTTSVPGNSVDLGGGKTVVVTGTRSRNVVNLDSISLSGGSTLIFTATKPGAEFVVNVFGKFELSGGSKILLQGSLTPYSIVFNQRSSEQVNFSGGSVVSGIVLAPYSNIRPDAGTFTGEIIGAAKGYQIEIASGEVIKHPPCKCD